MSQMAFDSAISAGHAMRKDVNVVILSVGNILAGDLLEP
jgi:hypothetical protein